MIDYKGVVVTSWGTGYALDRDTAWMVAPGSGVLSSSRNGGWHPNTEGVLLQQLFATWVNSMKALQYVTLVFSGV